MTRARVRKDSEPTTQPTVSWAIRAAATLPRGARVSNPLLGEDPTDTYAVVDTGLADMSAEQLDDVLNKATGALFVWDTPPSAEFVEAAMSCGIKLFKVCDEPDVLLGATYDLPDAPWLRLIDKGDLAIAPGDAGHLVPQQGDRFRRLRTKDSVIVDRVGLLNKSAGKITKDEDEADEDERYVLGVVLEPDEVDSQGDIISAEAIREAAHKYMQNYGNVGLQHQTFVNDKIKILESYVAPVDMEIGGQAVKAGTWLMAFRILDDSIWKAIKDGLLTGLSIGGTGLRIPVAA